MPNDFKHPAFADRNWNGCTTEKVNWRDEDYDETAGFIGLDATTHPDSTPHLFFVDLAVQDNTGREVVLERVEGGKLLSALLKAQDRAQSRKGSGAAVFVGKMERLP